MRVYGYAGRLLYGVSASLFYAKRLQKSVDWWAAHKAVCVREQLLNPVLEDGKEVRIEHSAGLCSHDGERVVWSKRDSIGARRRECIEHVCERDHARTGGGILALQTCWVA